MNTDHINEEGLVTLLEDPRQQLDSQFGRVSYGTWCNLEAGRINDAGGCVEVVRCICDSCAGRVAVARRGEA